TDFLLAGVGASVDTRTLRPGEVFFALPGKQAHGALYAAEALSKGAAAVVVPPEYATNLPKSQVVIHPEPLRLLGQIAALYRRKFSVPVIAIGGSNGKTTTKALLGHILSQYAPTLVSPRSWNNAIGVPLTLLRLRRSHKFVVIELGDNHPGEVHALCDIAYPTIGTITNIGQDHLEGYGDISTNLSTKWELVEHLAKVSGATFFLNGEDVLLSSQPLPPTLRVYRYGNVPNSVGTAFWQPIDWEASRIWGSIFGESFEAKIPLWGSFNRLNVLAALLIAHTLKVPLNQMIAALSTFRNEAYRSQVLRRGEKTIILDAYNANPSSLSASLAALWESLPEGNQVSLILGQMEELGSHTENAHKEALTNLIPHASHIKGIVLIGPYWERAFLQDYPFPIHWVHRVEDFPHQLEWLHSSSVIYLKGSRSQRLEQLVESGVIG
ncbi:MAG: UDP-N-acetylmuramoyl-tripeptide--D-alanyl-D-alanine ligase, partial [Bacteroidia bacterium]|nr:UDP-N-acetylmuramoyl-tripeptide--D-alanyl-D-alanine ligase [Bacteroidia bacterium]MDW8058395.1 UDP-N-acetylmuramoyl-tripeptide--D-alanyl-D-alanine ligase [Bacteroidia bacterium]